MQNSRSHRSLAELERLAIERWYDLEVDAAQNIVEQVQKLTRAELEQHPLLAISALVAQCRLGNEMNSGDQQPILSERISQLVETVPQIRTYVRKPLGECDQPASPTERAAHCVRHCENAEHWTLLRMMALRWRNKRAEALTLADALSRDTTPHTCAMHSGRRPDRYTLDRTRPGLLALQRGITYALAGRWSAALDLSIRASRCGGSAPRAHFAAVNGTANAALISALLGHTAHAHHWLSQHQMAAPVPEWCAPHVALGAHLAHALLHADQNQVAEAHRYRDTISERETTTELWPFVAHTLTRLDLLNHNPDTALRRLHDYTITRNTDVRDSTIAGGLLQRDYTNVLLQLGEGNLIMRIAEDQLPTPRTAIPVAHAWLRAGNPAHAHLHASHALRMPRITRREVVEAQLIRAAAHLHDDDATAATHQLRRCLSELMLHYPVLLRELPTDTITGLLALLSHTEQHIYAPTLPTTAHPPLTPITIVQLTPREQEILAQLAQGRSPQQIAASAVVSVQTVRSQLKTLYRKIGGRSAAETVARAYRLGVIAPDDVEVRRAGQLLNPAR